MDLRHDSRPINLFRTPYLKDDAVRVTVSLRFPVLACSPDAARPGIR